METTVYLDNGDTYDLRHHPVRTYMEAFSVLRIKQEGGSSIVFHSRDGFDTFIKQVSKLWAEGGEEIE